MNWTSAAASIGHTLSFRLGGWRDSRVREPRVHAYTAMANATAEPALEEGGGPATAAPAPAAPRTHCCSACSFPVAAYGRLVPCRHAFCLACATGHALCFLCQSSIARVERVEGPLWLSTVTLEAFDSEFWGRGAQPQPSRPATR